MPSCQSCGMEVLESDPQCAWCKADKPAATPPPTPKIPVPRVEVFEGAGGRAMKRCPFCAEDIRAEAAVCRYCQRPQPSLAKSALDRARSIGVRVYMKGEDAELHCCKEGGVPGEIVEELKEHKIGIIELLKLENLSQPPRQVQAPLLASLSGSSAVPSELSSAHVLGILAFIIGLCIGLYFLVVFDPSVSTPLGRVNNIGLMQERQNYMLAGFGLSFLGVLGAVANRK